MASDYIDAGSLDERAAVLTLTQEGLTYRWKSARLTWVKADLSTKTNVYSIHGVGATSVTFTMRRQPLTLGDALLWRGQHCFITNIAPAGRLHWTVEAALVVISPCEDKYTGTAFPGILAEEYLAHQQLEPQAVNTKTYVLVTPKAIQLTPGKLVRVDGTDWPIRVAYLLDPWKNEYKIERTVDL